MLGFLLAFGASVPVQSKDFAAAFLENGVGSRGQGMGSAFVAVVDDASASYWNPAGLTRASGKEVRAALRPLSLDRVQNSVSFLLNVRGDLAFGFTWLHAGVDEIQGRRTGGFPTGEIEDSENAFYMAVGRPVGERLALGAAVKILDQRIDVPDWKEATATGRGFDLGFYLRMDEKTSLGGALRNLSARLKWKVRRTNRQATTIQDDLPLTLVVGAAHRPVPSLLLAADLHRGDDLHFDLGAEWRTGPLLTLRGGFERMASETTAFTAGCTLRPMRRNALQFHYAYATDPLDAGARTSFGFTLRF